MAAKTAQPDLSEFFKYSQPKRPPCRVRVTLDQLSPEERGQFDAACAIDSGVITHMALAVWLERHAGEAWSGSWQHCLSHRQKKCSCERS